MSLQSFLYRESRWLRHNWGVLLILLLVLPALFAAATLAFGQVIPRDTPVAIVPADESVTEDELESVRGVAAFFSRPHDYETREAATRALHREDVYAAIVVPPDLFESDADATIEMVVEAEMVPYEQPSIAIASILRGRIDDVFPANVGVERTVVGEDRTLSGFLLGVGTMVFAMIIATVYLPHVVSEERSVFRRVRVTSSLWRLLAAKFALFAGLLSVPLLVLQAGAVHFGLDVALLAPGALVATLLVFLSLGAIGVGVAFLLSFGTTARVANVALLLGTVAFANMVYPAGFFSPLRRSIARLNPVHHATIVHRGASLKDLPAGLFADRLVLLAGFFALSVAFLVASVYVQQRRDE